MCSNGREIRSKFAVFYKQLSEFVESIPAHVLRLDRYAQHEHKHEDARSDLFI